VPLCNAKSAASMHAEKHYRTSTQLNQLWRGKHPWFQRGETNMEKHTRFLHDALQT